MRQLLLILSLFAVYCSLVTAKTPRDFSVVAYLPEWRYEGANWDTIFGTVTHLILFSIEVSPRGELGALDRIPRPELLNEAKEARTKHQKKLLLCVGGNGRSAGFGPMVTSPSTRATFISRLVSICKEKGLDGVDYNWEYPGYTFGRGYNEEQTVTDYRGFNALLTETKKEFDKAGLILTLAYYPDEKQERLLLQGSAVSSASLLHMMSYDQPGKHSTMEFAMKVADQGARILPPKSLTLGLPFYSRWPEPR